MNKKLPSPPRDFSYQATAFAQFVEAHAKLLPVLDAKLLAANAKAQAADKAAEAEARIVYAKVHETFTERQAARFETHMDALRTARALCARRPELLQALDAFKRTQPRRRKTSPADGAKHAEPTHK